MGHSKRTTREGQSGASDSIETEHDCAWCPSPSSPAGDGEVRGSGDQVSAYWMDAYRYTVPPNIKKACDEAYKDWIIDGTGAQTVNEQPDFMTQVTDMWKRWTFKPSYFDTVTNIVEQISALELQLRDDERAAKDKLVEIEHARIELQRRVRCA